MKSHVRISRSLQIGAVVVTGAALSACGSSSAKSSLSSTPTTKPAGGGSSRIFPVTSNPIVNASTTRSLKIDSVVVENNVNAATGKAGSDHLEIAMTNTGSTVLSGFEVYYTMTDTKTKASESYDAKLPATFTIGAGQKRIAHFDNTGVTDHFPVNKFNIYYTSKNALDLSVTVSAPGAAPATATVKKGAGGTEQSD